VVEKVLIALLGAFAGVVAKTVADVYRARVLLPVVLEQVRQTASICSNAFAVGEVKAAAPVCDSAFKGLSELVALGVRPTRTWRKGAELLLATSVEIGTAASVTGLLVGGALDRLHERAGELQRWLEATMA
jgi:hypothetical protein